MNPKAIIPRGTSKVFVYPYGRQPQQQQQKRGSKKDDDMVDNDLDRTLFQPQEIGSCRVAAVPMKAGVIDPSWSKGRPMFRIGRLPGLM